MVGMLVPVKGGRLVAGRPSPNWQEKCHLYTTYSPCRTWGVICYRTTYGSFSGEKSHNSNHQAGQKKIGWWITSASLKKIDIVTKSTTNKLQHWTIVCISTNQFNGVVRSTNRICPKNPDPSCGNTRPSVHDTQKTLKTGEFDTPWHPKDS